MGLAHTWRTKEDHVFSIFQEAHGSQFVDLALINRGLEGKIEVIQGLLDGEPRKDCVKENKRHPFSQELEQETNLIERMYHLWKRPRRKC